MTQVSFAKGAMAATAAAGPLVMAPLLVAGVLHMQPLESLRMLPTAFILMLVAMIVGMIVSLLPNLLGTALLGLLGCRFRWVRHPLVWAPSGTALGLLVGLGLFAGEPGGGGPAVMAGAGTACSLICRWGTQWYD